MASPSAHLPIPPQSPNSQDAVYVVSEPAGGQAADSKPSSGNDKGKATASKPRRRFVGKTSMTSSSTSSSSRTIPHSSIPPDILQDPLLAEAIAQNLPKNYEFEVHKTIWNIRKWDCKMVALQMPEGLLMWGCVLSDIIERFTSAQTVILGDVTYGACCIDDYTAIALECDMLVHYGHSCLVPIDSTSIRTLYVFVEISIDSEHLAKTIRRNFPSNRELFERDVVLATASSAEGGSDVPIGSVIGGQRRIEGRPSTARAEIELESQNNQRDRFPSPLGRTRLALVSTIQFAAALNRLKEDLSVPVGEEAFPREKITDQKAENSSSVAPYHSTHDLDPGVYEITVPRSKPLSPGEILGCTAPRLNDVDAILYLADGRFHLEAIMIANPSVPAFRYDPYSKKLTREWYDHDEMRSVRGKAVMNAKATLPLATPASDYQADTRTEDETSRSEATHSPGGQVWGVILGTLGRQGSLLQMEAILRQLDTYMGSGATSSPLNPSRVPYMPILLSELSPAKLALFNEGIDPTTTNANITTFIQTSCPRLSIDWGYAFEKPLLSPYEAAVALGRVRGWEEDERRPSDEPGTRQAKQQKKPYPMDFYEAGSIWSLSRVKGSETTWPIDVGAH